VLHNLCKLCLRVDCPSTCPCCIPPKTNHYCSSCGDGIFEGEEYIENLDGEYHHYECFHGMRDLLEWLGYEIKTMEE